MAEKHNPTKQYCPNCSGEAVREGNEITCEVCDATFTIKKTGGARVKTLGRIAGLEDRIGRLEELLPDDEGQPQEQQPQEPPAEPVEPEESENDLLPPR